MLKQLKIIVSMLISLSLLCGCGASPVNETSVVKSDSKEETVVLREKGHSVLIPKTKEETVNVTADAYGRPVETNVQVLLKGFKNSDLIKDYTYLTDIKNTKGDEEFTLKNNGTLLWENHGEDINYEGKSDDDLPVDVKISYKLNGKEISADDLKGQSGRVTMRFDYVNHETKVSNGVGVYVPFTAISAVMLSDDVFKNVKVTNGSLTTMSDTTIAMGMVFPGLAESLNLDRYDLTDDIDLPEYVEIKADVTRFELDYTATIITSGLLNDADLSQLDDVNDLSKALNKLSDASNKLVKGSAQLYSGANKFSTYLDQYVDGVAKVSKGSKQLSSALTTLDDKTGTIAKTATDYLKELKEIKTLLSDEALQEWLKKSGLDYDNISDALTALSEGASQLSELITALQATLSAYQSYDEVIAQAADALSAIDVDALEASVEESATAAAQKAASEVLSETELSDEQKQAVLDAIESGIKEGVDLSATFNEILTQTDIINTASEQLGQIDTTEIDALLTTMAEQMKELEKAIATYGEQLEDIDIKELFKVLDTSVDELSSQIKAYAGGVSQLSKGAKQLSKGTKTLSKTGKLLSKNYKTLTKGMSSLSSGMRMFDKKGIRALSDLGTDDLKALVKRLKLLQKADKSYNNFSGKMKGEKSSVRFIIETEEIKAEDD